jgi:hypothetical protein
MTEAMTRTIAALRDNHAAFDSRMAEALDSGIEDDLRAAIDQARSYAANLVETVSGIMAEAAARMIERDAKHHGQSQP